MLSKGAKGEWTPDDLRRTGATMLQELGVTLEIIDRCQNHLLGGSKVCPVSEIRSLLTSGLGVRPRRCDES